MIVRIVIDNYGINSRRTYYIYGIPILRITEQHKQSKADIAAYKKEQGIDVTELGEIISVKSK